MSRLIVRSLWLASFATLLGAAPGQGQVSSVARNPTMPARDPQPELAACAPQPEGQSDIHVSHEF